ncbi:DUF6403 family protein [Micromonosporaceae bacterium DT55]|uniref:DUF6403 family protein n=1 Tax=Melissospora conviva TaxID=3388432 RepID=UPI003C1DCC6D
MSLSWLIWPAGLLLLLGAGFAAGLLPALRTRQARRAAAWTAARAAVESAAISRDAAPEPVPAAEELLHRAELIVAAGGGPSAAATAAEQARRADRMWRGDTDA